jgi:hypothetical protein
MRKHFSLLFAGAAVLLMAPLASFAQEEEEPETRIITITRFTVPLGEDIGKFRRFVDTYMMPSVQENPYIRSFRVGRHYWGQTHPNIWLITEYALLGDIQAAEEWDEAWFEEHYPEGTPEAEAAEKAWMESFLPFWRKHTDEILRVNMSEAK